MSDIVYKIVNKAVKSGRTWLEDRKRRERQKVISQGERYSLVSPDELGVFVKELKPSTVEKVSLIPIYGITEDGCVSLNSLPIRCYQYNNVVIRSNADYILNAETKSAVWWKSVLPASTKNVPMDKGLLSCSDDCIVVEKPADVFRIGKAFMLCGVYSDVWSHFMIQRASLLYGLLELPADVLDGLTVLTPAYNDAHLKKVVTEFVNRKLPQVRLIEVEPNQFASCDILYAMNSATTMIDNETYVSYVDMVIPQYVESQLRNYMIPVCDNVMPYRKLYIRRKGSYRNMVNNDEVELLFSNLGFELIEPHLLSYEEKVAMFHEAEVIVGPYSSGFSNMIYCQEGTKVLILTNLQRAFEPFLTFYVQHWHLKAMFVTGKDENQQDSHSDFYIPLNRIEEALNELMN